MGMNKAEFEERVQSAQNETHKALATVLGELNHGQQQKLLKDAEVAAVLKRYGVVGML